MFRDELDFRFEVLRRFFGKKRRASLIVASIDTCRKMKA